MPNQKQGFTLVELAIVIVIIGLLTVGIMQGGELIKSSRINSTVSKVNGYNSSVSTFRAKFGEFPGDVSRATKMGLNTAKGSPVVNVCSTDSTPVTATAGGNGNGNNIIEGQDVSNNCIQTSFTGNRNLAAYAGFGGELGNFFVHLSNAQLIKESFSQPVYPSAIDSTYPSIPLGGGMMPMTDNGTIYWTLGTPVTLVNIANVTGNNLSPYESYSIDSKLDDGAPLTGVVQAVSSYNYNFTIASPGATSCVFTGGTTYNTLGSLENSRLCTLRIQGSF